MAEEVKTIVEEIVDSIGEAKNEIVSVEVNNDEMDASDMVEPEVMDASNTVAPEVIDASAILEPEITDASNTVVPEVIDASNTVAPEVMDASNAMDSVVETILKTKTIKYSRQDIIDMLTLSMLVYNYGKDFVGKEHTELAELVSKIKNDSECDIFQKLSPQRKEALLQLSHECPHGEILGFIDDEKTDLQAIICKNDDKKRISVVFRGSESLKDWYYDFTIFKILLENGCKVHKGFMNQLKNGGSLEAINAIVKKELTENNDYTLFVSGHSLAGALCTLYGYLLACEMPTISVQVISFASPRVGDVKWKNAFDNQPNIQHLRVTNNHDIITSVPMIGYKHVGDVLHLVKGGYVYYPSYSYNLCCSYTMFNKWSTKDHNCDLYYENLMSIQLFDK